MGRSREGAWIEIISQLRQELQTAVAPVRERGLKLEWHMYHYADNGRSREGAWIEIRTLIVLLRMVKCRSREGAWIEIEALGKDGVFIPVAPVRERGLK